MADSGHITVVYGDSEEALTQSGWAHRLCGAYEPDDVADEWPPRAQDAIVFRAA